MSFLKDISHLKYMQDEVYILGKIDVLLTNNSQNEMPSIL